MINIKIFFFSLLADIVGKDEIILNIDNPITIRDLLIKLSSKLGREFKTTIILSEGKLNKYIILGLNGKDIRQFNGMNTVLEDRDELSFLPAIAGG
ncbi:MAG: MoaD/ThiS family protein [Promethearchaeota archaeon]